MPTSRRLLPFLLDYCQALPECAALVALLLLVPVSALLAVTAFRSRKRLAHALAESAEANERLRIAGELHDVVGHSMAGIGVQSSAALHLLRQEESEAVGALLAIRTASRTALRELQTTAGLLHGESPGLDRLDALLDAMRQAGLAVQAEQEGDPVYLPAPLSHAAYRILQEALANVLRHAGPSASATVTVVYGRGELTLRVTDDGSAPTAPGQGAGIPAMRARAEAQEGTLTAGPGEPGGFEVVAHLPLISP